MKMPISVSTPQDNLLINGNNNGNNYNGKIPRLEEYGIDPVTGFIPRLPPLQRLPRPFEEWELILDDIHSLVTCRKLRERVHRLPLIAVAADHELKNNADNNIIGLNGQREWQRAFLVLSMISHAYVWGDKGDPVMQVLPRCLAVPWIKVSVWLGLRPTSCHAALVYYNFGISQDLKDTEDSTTPTSLSSKVSNGNDSDNWINDEMAKLWRLENVKALHTISNTDDEQWFYLVTLAVESSGAPALSAILHALSLAHSTISPNLTNRPSSELSGKYMEISRHLKTVLKSIERMSESLARMPERCAPSVFYEKVRVYFSGWSGMRELPRGLVYEGDEDEVERMFVFQEGDIGGCSRGFSVHSLTQNSDMPSNDVENNLEDVAKDGDHILNDRMGKIYPGGSAAQSALIHALDVFMGVQHFPTAATPSQKSSNIDLTNNQSNNESEEDVMNKKEKEGKRINFLKDMRYHMPREFRRFLRDLENAPQLSAFLAAAKSQFVASNSTNPSTEENDQVENAKLERAIDGAVEMFNKCVDAMKRFRDLHIQIVTRYIVVQARRAQAAEQEDTQPLHPSASPSNRKEELTSLSLKNENRGTGGTDLMPFLKQSRDETAAAALRL